MPSWAQLKAKAKSWVHSKKRSPTDAYSDSSEDGHSPRQEPDTRRVMVPAPPAPGLFRSLAEPAQNLFAAPAGATAHPDPAQLPGEHHRKEKSALRLLAEEAGGAGVAPAEHWGRAYLDGTRQRRASHGEKQVTHEQSTREHGESAKDRGGGEEQAVGVLEQMGGQQGSCGPPSPQGVTQVGAVAGPTEAETANDRAAARGVDTELAGSCHINIGAAETPKAESEQGSKLKGKAQEVPDNSKGDKSYIPMSRYDHILAAIALPAASPREGAPWWEQAPAASDQRSGGESSGSQASRLHQILSAVAIPTTEPAPAVETLQDSSNKRDENEAGPSDGGGFLGLGAGRGAETSEKPAAEVKEGDAGEVRQDQDPDMDEIEPAPLVLHRHHRPRPALPPAVQQLFDKQDALAAQLVMHDADPAHQPLLTRLGNIRAMLLESGPFLGDLELESLQGEVEAMAVYVEYAREERDTELDRRLSASLQEEFDQEMAEQLERDNGWPTATEQDQLVECCICLEEVLTKDCIAPCLVANDSSTGEDEEDEEEAADSTTACPELPSGTCSHWHCIDCLRQYATVKVMDDRTCRIPCTRASEGCPALFPFENVEWLLGDKETQLYLQLLAEASITTKVYCPFDGCTAVMDCAEDERGPDSICASCKRVFCRACRVAWHAEQTCEQYQSAKQDEPLHVLAKQQHWKPCPKCRTMIERQDGCNYMTCKCGAGFCYKCGTAYVSLKGTASNVHGTPGCKCKLF